MYVYLGCGLFVCLYLYLCLGYLYRKIYDNMSQPKNLQRIPLSIWEDIDQQIHVRRRHEVGERTAKGMREKSAHGWEPSFLPPARLATSIELL